jgi:hypothetical protein
LSELLASRADSPFMHSRFRTQLRFAAALLAWVGMLALPLRTLAACPMLEPSEGAAVMHHAALVGDADEHAGHDMTGMLGESSEAPAAPDAPTHETCPDLAHCAVAAVPAPLTLAADPTTPAVALRLAAQTAPLSVARALEPPPPKA